MNQYSIKINLKDFIGSQEKLIIENLRYCKTFVGKRFKFICDYKGVDSVEIKNFLKRNKDLLFEVGVEMVSENSFAWFIIDDKKIEKINWRYRWNGEILEGLVEYRKLVEHIKQKKSE